MHGPQATMAWHGMAWHGLKLVGKKKKTRAVSNDAPLSATPDVELGWYENHLWPLGFTAGRLGLAQRHAAYNNPNPGFPANLIGSSCCMYFSCLPLRE